MELSKLIDRANDINEYWNNTPLTEPVSKEIKKIEMYTRKTFIMLREIEEYMSSEDMCDDTFLTQLNKRLVRDQQYVKTRDNLDSYTI